MKVADLAALPTHPAADVMPTLDQQALVALAADIEKNGCHAPVVLYEGAVLDGRHRIKAAEMAGLKSLAIIAYEGDDPLAYVLSTNLHRRHLTTGQKADLAVNILAYEEAAAKERQGERTDLGLNSDRSEERTWAAAEAGKKVGVGKDSVQKMAFLRDKAEDGDTVAASVLSKVRKGELSLNQAVQTARPATVAAPNAEKELARLERAYNLFIDAIIELKKANPNEEQRALAARLARYLADYAKELA